MGNAHHLILGLDWEEVIRMAVMASFHSGYSLMSKILPFPDEPDPCKREKLLLGDSFLLRTGGSHGTECIYPKAVLVAPPRESHESQQMIVLNGSRFRPRYHRMKNEAQRTFDRLLAEGKIKSTDDPYIFSFIEDVLFPSPSRAANVMQGTSCNGWEAWSHGPTGYPLTKSRELDDERAIDLVYFKKPADIYEVRERD